METTSENKPTLRDSRRPHASTAHSTESLSEQIGQIGAWAKRPSNTQDEPYLIKDASTANSTESLSEQIDKIGAWAKRPSNTQDEPYLIKGYLNSPQYQQYKKAGIRERIDWTPELEHSLQEGSHGWPSWNDDMLTTSSSIALIANQPAIFPEPGRINLLARHVQSGGESLTAIDISEHLRVLDTYLGGNTDCESI
ncbi:TEA/ATTS domain family-domain-containing protein [Penicillium verhagenii]|uniref:TEA/ATTS domain family-domain-containing protein n=1 Tax=Penicillium verhagenii TaxID=1562060 RepID=UPI002545A7C5|nr:TEA/ATTS domain family-domain-containing protein [Penicillium verhagenii]KAJ5928440.1 TEA/ATTS domain family-domain-containing protein [Penicillium verhagenii]